MKEFLKLDIQFFAASGSATNSSLKSSEGNKGTLTVSFTEATLTEENKKNNESTITAKATFKQVTGTYSGYALPYLRLYWYDDNEHTKGTEIAKKNVTAISKGETVTISFTLDVKHKEDGTLNGYAKAKWEYDGTGTLPCKTGYATTSETALTTIPRASKLGTLSNFTLNETINIPITKQYDSFTDVLTISLNDTTIKTINDIDDGFQLTFTEDELKTIYSLMPNSEKALIKFTLTTMSGDSQVGYCWASVWGTIPTSVHPEISTLTITEANTNVPSSWNVFIQGKSQLKIDVEAEAGYGATISSYKIVANGETFTNSSATTSILTSSGMQTISAIVTDSRTREVLKGKTINVVDYFAPNASGLSVYRCNQDGTLNDEGVYVKAYMNWSIAPVENKNTKKAYIQYYDIDSQEWKTVATFEDSYVASSRNYLITNKEFNVDNTYQFRLVVEDLFSGDIWNALPLLPSYTLVNYHANGKSIGFGKVADREEGFQFGDFIYDQWDTVITNGLAVYGGDPDTTLESLIMTSTNSPSGEAMFFHTFFSSNKSENQNCGQLAVPYYYNGTQSIYWRYRFAGSWSEWKRLTNASEIGELSDLETNYKSSIVKAINSVNEKATRNYIQIRPSSDYSIKTTNTNEVVPLTYQMSKGGDKLTLNNDGTVTIGSGVSKIKVSSSITFANITTSTTKNLYYYLNDNTNVRFIQSYAPANYSTIISISDYYIDVKEGDIFSLRTYGTAGEIIRSTRSHLTIEVIA